MAHLHSIYDSDLHFVIDPVTRVITNQSENKNSVIQFDHNSERFTFELPRYIEEHDMLGCNRVEVHYVNIDSKTGNQSNGVYDVQDLQVSPHDENVAICSWLVSNNATQYAGTLSFVIRFACTSGDVVDYVWNTAMFKNYAVQNGLYNSDPIVAQYPDVLAEWYQSLFTASDDGVTNIQEARAAAITAVDAVADERIADIEKAGSDVITSLPPEYLEMVENMAPPIVETATGEAIAIRDGADRRLRGLTLYGKSTQDGTPTPEAPVEIESVENPTVRVCGKNLWNHDYDTVDMSALSGWGSAIWRSEDVVKVLKPNTTYTMRFVVTCLSVPEYESVFSEDCGFVLYSAQESGKFIRMAMSQDEGAFSVGDRRIATCTFTTPANVRDASMGYEILRYVQRYKQADGTAVYATAKFEEVQLEEYTTATSYEPYTEQTLPVTRTLPGIPVTSGGNYTDENGQQWICDEVDFERGVYVQRVRADNFDGGNVDYWWEYNSSGYEGYARTLSEMLPGLRWNGYCNRFPTHPAASNELGLWFGADNNVLYLHSARGTFPTLDQFREWLSANPMTVVYPLATPIETALTAEELAAYASLRSNYPNTSVLNDGGAGMTVAYVADTKLYIDKKLSV